VLLLICFRAVLFHDEQFAYRDAAHFYYPLYLRVQQEWDAGRWPLWDPGQNAGMPLLGMPMAAVLYPGKVLYALFAYAWAARLYTIAHVIVAWAGMFAVARVWGQSAIAAGIAGMAYAFGAPVLFQYCNIIFLVGAAWVPWGFLALELLLHRKSRWGLLSLAAVLALQVLGGDPEAAYLTVLCGGVYALVLAAEGSRMCSWRWWWWGALALVAWVTLTLVAAYALPWLAMPGRLLRASVWGLVALGVAWRSWQRPRDARLAPLLVQLAAACALAALLAAVEFLPSLEYTSNTLRAADERPSRNYGFCVEPYRMLEMIWPCPFGRFGPENRSWIQAISPAGERQIWAPSLYLGGLTLVLAMGGFGFRGGPPWRPWLSLVALAALAASFGKFGGPLWIVRWLPGASALLGPHDPLRSVDRVDVFCHDGAGSFYGLLAAALPGFDVFRYPGKLSTFTAVALAGLAGAGWDRLAANRSYVPRYASRAALTVSLVALGPVLAARAVIREWLQGRLPPDIEFGPVDPWRAIAGTTGSLIHGGTVFTLALGLTIFAPRYPRRSGTAALLVMALDLGLANAPLVWTVPQVEFNTPARAALEIAAAERAGPSGVSARSMAPFRVHRMGTSYPEGFAREESPQRLRRATAWERDTLHPLYALPLKLDYTLVQGVIESDDYAQFFGSRLITPRDASGSATAAPVYSLPRRGFDLWNSRYFLMPVAANGWLGEERDFERIYPRAEVVADARRAREWIERENWQLLRNKTVFPRAWPVHFFRVRSPITDQRGLEAAKLMDDLVYQSDAFWNDPQRGVYDLRMMAFVETDQPQGLAGYVARAAVAPNESVTITRYEPQRVELVAELERPGLVILADVYYPGWRLTIDGDPARIYRTNRLMRGAAVRAGRHVLVYTYDPSSFAVGGTLSITGLVVLFGLVPWARAART
jgi:hypothetical protein